jgi:hypothetical protein
MTRDEAIAEAERKQHSHPDAKWIAAQNGSEWIVARVGLPPATIKPTGTTTKPPPLAPQDDPQSPLQRAATLYGTAG